MTNQRHSVRLMELSLIRDLLNDSIMAEQAKLRSAAHPQVIAGHQAAIKDFEQRLRELDEAPAPALSV
jgi:hypothetical protein